jgi:hypothetical protein
MRLAGCWSADAGPLADRGRLEAVDVVSATRGLPWIN